jgi:hypothetical protein
VQLPENGEEEDTMASPPLLLQLSTLEENSYFRLNLMASNIPLHLLPALLNREEMREVFFLITLTYLTDRRKNILDWRPCLTTQHSIQHSYKCSFRVHKDTIVRIRCTFVYVVEDLK